MGISVDASRPGRGRREDGREIASSPRNGKPRSTERRGVDEDEGSDNSSVSSLLRAGGVENVSSCDSSEDESNTHGLEKKKRG